MYKNTAIAVAKAISTVAELNKNKREDSGLCVFFKSSPGNKKATDSE